MTQYASVLRLDRAAIKALKVTDTYSLHRVVYDLFPDVRTLEQKQASVTSGIQWVDKGGDFRCRQILMLSDRLPNEAKAGELETRTLPAGFLDHDHYRFTVTLNPSRRNHITEQLQPVKGREAIAAWFIERGAASWGFAVDPMRLQIDDVAIQRFTDKHGRDVTIQQATLSGFLSVTDRANFHQSFKNGIGRHRSFGCGLMQIVPIVEQPIF